MAPEEINDVQMEEKKSEEEEEDPLWNDVSIEEIKKEAPTNPVLLDKAKPFVKEISNEQLN